MSLNTEQLLRQITKATEGKSFGSESEYPIRPFLWDVSKQGILTPDKLLVAEGFLQKESLDTIFPQNLRLDRISFIKSLQENHRLRQELIESLSSSNINIDEVNIDNISPPKLRYLLSNTEDYSQRLWEADQKQKELLDFLSLNCKSVEVYMVRKDDADDYPDNEFEAFPLIIAQTSSGTWLGIVPEIDVEPNACRTEKVHGDAKYCLEDEEIDESLTSFLEEVKQRVSEVKFLTRQYYEMDYEVDKYILQTSNSKSKLLSQWLYSNGFISIFQFEEFGIDYGNLKILDEILNLNLTSLREYIVGCMSIFYLYDVGQTPKGDWVGIRTTAIWT